MQPNPDVIYFWPDFVRKTGSAAAALFLSQAVAWSQESTPGWVSKSLRDWEEKTGLKPESVKKSQQRLVALGFLKERPGKTGFCLTKMVDLPSRAYRRAGPLKGGTALPQPCFPEGEQGEGMIKNIEGKIFQACKDLRDLTKQRTGKHYTDHILQRRWRTLAESFVREQLQGNQDHFLIILTWYMQNIDGEYMPECGSIPQFCNKFRQLEKARMRQSQNGNDPQNSTVDKIVRIIRKTNIIKGTKVDLRDTW